MSLNNQLNIFNLPIHIRRRLFGGGGGSGISLDITQATPHITQITCYDIIKIGDIVGILDNRIKEHNNIQTDDNFVYPNIFPNAVLGFKQDPVLYPQYLKIADFYLDVRTFGIALSNGQNKDIINVQIAYEYDYNGVRLNDEEENRYNFSEGLDCYLAPNNEIIQFKNTNDFNVSNDFNKLCRIGIATSPTKILLNIKDYYIN